MMLDAVGSARLTPDKPILRVGDELNCSARGNPTPRLAFSPATTGGRNDEDGGEAWKTMVVPESWKDQVHTVTCTAANELNNETHEVTANATFKVIGQ